LLEGDVIRDPSKRGCDGESILLEAREVVVELPLNEDFVALFPLSYSLSKLLDDPSDICPKNGGELLEENAILFDLPVHRVQRSSDNLQKHLALARLRHWLVTDGVVAEFLCEVERLLGGRCHCFACCGMSG
jgi:hypothetical protein